MASTTADHLLRPSRWFGAALAYTAAPLYRITQTHAKPHCTISTWPTPEPSGRVTEQTAHCKKIIFIIMKKTTLKPFPEHNGNRKFCGYKFSFSLCVCLTWVASGKVTYLPHITLKACSRRQHCRAFCPFCTEHRSYTAEVRGSISGDGRFWKTCFGAMSKDSDQSQKRNTNQVGSKLTCVRPTLSFSEAL